MLKYQKHLPYLEESLANSIVKTPLVFAKNLSNTLNTQVHLKLDSTLPFSHTFKDRGAITAISEILNTGKNKVMCASCGNMSSAIAGVSAKAGVKCFVILSSEASIANKLSMFYTGAELFEYEGRFDVIDDLIAEFSKKYPEIACINTNLMTTYMLGLKSLYFELFEDLAEQHQAVNILVPTADGTLMYALFLAYQDYQKEYPDIEFNPRFILVQAKNCSPLVSAFHSNSNITRWDDHIKTSVLSLSVDYPKLNGHNALYAVKSTNGTAIAIDEELILDSSKLLASSEGIFTDDVGGIVIGALQELNRKKLLDNLPTICLLTGNGLKTVDKFQLSYNRENQKYNNVDDFLNFIL